MICPEMIWSETKVENYAAEGFFNRSSIISNQLSCKPCPLLTLRTTFFFLWPGSHGAKTKAVKDHLNRLKAFQLKIRNIRRLHDGWVLGIWGRLWASPFLLAMSRLCTKCQTLTLTHAYHGLCHSHLLTQFLLGGETGIKLHITPCDLLLTFKS